MSGQNVIPLDPSRRARREVVGNGTLAMLVFVVFEAMMFTGMVSAFMLTRAAAAATWPPPGQPWFPMVETAINTAALLVSGALVFLAARARDGREAQIGPLLIAGIALGAFFVFFQGVVWVTLLRQGLTLTSSHHGNFFCLIMGIHGANILGALVFIGVARARLMRGSLDGEAFPAARVLWYFVVGLWPVLYLCLYL